MTARSGRRYGTFKITGFPINPLAPNIGGKDKPRTTHYVYDSANCGAIVFVSETKGKAQTVAVRLNKEDEAWDRRNGG